MKKKDDIITFTAKKVKVMKTTRTTQIIKIKGIPDNKRNHFI